jgi:hypothetical protein
LLQCIEYGWLSLPDTVLNKQQVIEAIRRHVEDHGSPPERARFKRDHIVPSSAFDGMYWARWTDAVREAGFEPLERPETMDSAHLLDCLVS